jgi:hypothetical protein
MTRLEKQLEMKRWSADWGCTLCYKSIEILVGRLRDIQVSFANIVNGLIVDHELEQLVEFRMGIQSNQRFRGSRGW